MGGKANAACASACVCVCLRICLHDARTAGGGWECGIRVVSALRYRAPLLQPRRRRVISTPMFKRTLLAALVAVGALAPMVAAQAAGPMVKTQAPGFYRIMVGDIEVTALSDGTVGLPVTKLLTNTTADASEKALARSFLKDPVLTR